MRKNIDVIVFVLGLLAVVWVAAVHAVSNPMVLAVCALIALVYGTGGVELRRYRQATANLQTALDELKETPEQLDAWLQRIDAGLRTVVRLRVAGERIALPAPTLPAYLSGVLVLLGMLGTLLGMMVTLQGTGLALESASDLQAIRDSLAAPVKGLGYAFGTSIAGIATSAVLGVLTALCRRERLAVARALDAAIAGPLQVFTRDHRNDDTWRLMREQSLLMPALVERLQALSEAIDRRDAAAHTQQGARQEAFLARSETAYEQLAERVRVALEESVTQNVQAVSSALQPVAQTTMADIATSARSLHDGVQQSAQQSLQAQAVQLQTTMAEMSTHLQQTQQAAQLVMAAEVQQVLSDNRLRDTTMLAERNQLLETFGTLLETVNHATHAQHVSIEALVSTSAELLERVGTRFDARIEADATKLDAAATRAAAGAVEVMSVVDAFGAAVETFAASNAEMAERLQRIEGALDKTLTRSDEQLVYYVAQAREVVDLSLLAQRQIVDDLRKLDGQRSAAASAA